MTKDNAQREAWFDAYKNSEIYERPTDLWPNQVIFHHGFDAGYAQGWNERDGDPNAKRNAERVKELEAALREVLIVEGLVGEWATMTDSEIAINLFKEAKAALGGTNES